MKIVMSQRVVGWSLYLATLSMPIVFVLLFAGYGFLFRIIALIMYAVHTLLWLPFLKSEVSRTKIRS